MKDPRPPRSADWRPLSISLVTTYPPTRCGIGRFSRSLVDAMAAAAPDTRVGVARIATSGERHPDGAAEVTFDPVSAVARRRAARRLSRSDAVILQHEYGLYGPRDGVAVLDLVGRIESPLVTVVHTVRPSPGSRQRRIVEALGRAGVLVVLSQVARQQLVAAHEVDPARVWVIPHGSPWRPAPGGPAPRRKIITWGLLGPGKGIERALRAVARLRLDPPVTYDVVGQTHPNVLARHGQEYRMSLERLAADLQLQDRVRFIDRYVCDQELERMVAAADLAVLPYDSHEQVCSGVLTDAVAAGRPFVATAFPHARELAGLGCGRAVGHHPAFLAGALHDMLTDDTTYGKAVAAATRISPSLSWSGVALAYLDLTHSLRADVVVA